MGETFHDTLALGAVCVEGEHVHLENPSLLRAFKSQKADNFLQLAEPAVADVLFGDALRPIVRCIFDDDLVEAEANLCHVHHFTNLVLSHLNDAVVERTLRREHRNEMSVLEIELVVLVGLQVRVYHVLLVDKVDWRVSQEFRYFFIVCALLDARYWLTRSECYGRKAVPLGEPITPEVHLVEVLEADGLRIHSTIVWQYEV